jgi:WD40 repeat protein
LFPLLTVIPAENSRLAAGMSATKSAAPAFGAFISYKRADEAFAVLLEKALEGFIPPRDLDLPQRRLNIFRDKEDLTGTEYHASIRRYLESSTKLIVVCSPHARSSAYVNEEIRTFASGRRESSIIPILLSGLANNEASPEQEAQKAFPDALCELQAIPLAADYRGFDPRRDRVDKGRFEGAWYTLLANIYDVSRSELEQRDKRRQARTRRVRMLIAGAVGVALVALTIWALASRQEALSRQLAANSISQLSIDPEQSILLASEALRAKGTDEAEAALRRALVRSHVRRVFHGHTDWVNDVVFSPSGRLIASASNDKTVRIADVATGELLHVLTHQQAVYSLSFGADDTEILSVTDETVTIWNAITGSLVSEMKGYQASFSADGRLVITAAADGAYVWEKATGKTIWRVDSQPPGCVALSPDGKSALVCAGSAAQLWQLTPSRRLRTFQHDGLVTHTAFSADGQLIVTASEDRTAKVWELESRNSWTLQPHPREVIWAGFARDGSRTVVTVSDKAARVWTNEATVRVRGHTDWVTSADFNPDGQLLVTASQDGSARVWDTATGVSIADLLGHRDSVVKARFSADGRLVATASMDRTVRIWDIATGIQLRGHTDWVTNAAFDRTGERVVTTSWDGTVGIWNARTGESIRRIEPAAGGLNKAAFSPDGRFVVAVGVNGLARTWNAATGEPQHTLSGHTIEPYMAVYSHDGSKIITAGGQDRMVKIWNAGTGKEEATLQPHATVVTSASFSPDDRSVLTTGADQQAQVLDLATQKSVVFRGHSGIVYAGAFSADGAKVVTGSGDLTARVWDARTGREISVLRGHTARLADVAFSPNGRLVVTSSADKTARVWETETGRLLVVLENHADLVSSASFSPDARYVLTSSDDGTARIIDCSVCEASIDNIVEVARNRVTRELPAEQRSSLSRFRRMFGL